MVYYGILANILELDYSGSHRVFLLECDWVSKRKRLKKDSDGFILANFMMYKHFKSYNFLLKLFHHLGC